MKKLKIWIDMDEVLSESVDYIFEQIGFEVNWFKLDKNKIQNYTDVFKWSWIDFNEAVRIYTETMKKDIWNFHIKPVTWSIEKVSEFKEKWHELFVITARNSKFFSQYTLEWTKKHFQDVFNEIFFADHFTDKHKEKSEICKEQWIELMIEDNLDYAIELANNWIITFLLDKPWNIYRKQHYKNIIRVNDWTQINI
jgi:uncharacterized HAD superfamily protein